MFRRMLESKIEKMTAVDNTLNFSPFPFDYDNTHVVEPTHGSVVAFKTLLAHPSVSAWLSPNENSSKLYELVDPDD